MQRLPKALFYLLFMGIAACKHKPAPVPEPASLGGFPADVSSIIVTKCATAGCHNAQSYTNSGGLRLDSWAHLFEGGYNGSVVVPYSPAYSPLLYFINTDSSLGPVAEPTMPYNAPPLSKEEYLTIKNWIADGAPDKDGNIAFSSAAGSRQKVYWIHRGCDVVGVMDAEKHVVMRYIEIGEHAYPESPSYIRVTPDGRYAFVSFWYSPNLYKIDTHTDEVVAKIDLGESFWSVLNISDDGQKLLLTNTDNYSVLLVDAAGMQMQTIGNGDMESPFAIAANAGFDTFFVSSLLGNTVYKLAANYTKKISIDNKPLTTAPSGNAPDPWEIMMSPDYSRYFLACAGSNEVRVMDAYADTLIKTIPVGIQPQGMAMSKTQPYLFVSCPEDNVSQAGFKGSVYVLNYNTLEVVKKIEGRFYQPHGVAVNDKDNNFFVFSRNQNYDGPAPHHSGPCSGRNGYYNVYDLTTLEPATGRRYEVLVDPYVGDTRFK